MRADPSEVKHGAWRTRRRVHGESGHAKIRRSRFHKRHNILRSRGKIANVTRETAA